MITIVKYINYAALKSVRIETEKPPPTFKLEYKKIIVFPRKNNSAFRKGLFRFESPNDLHSESTNSLKYNMKAYA